LVPRIPPPPSFRHERNFAFAKGDAGRPLRLVVDTDTVTEGEALECLRQFAHHPAVEILMPTGGPHPLIIGDYDAAQGIIPIEYTIGERRTRSAVYASDYLAIATDTAAPEEAGAARRAITIAAAAEQVEADALATRSAFVLEHAPRPLVREANPVTPEGAVSLLGLYLRLRGDFTVDFDKGWGDVLGRHFSYFVLMRELLPSAWRWFSGCVAQSLATKEDELMMIAQSAMERVDRALRARDRMHGQLQLPPGREVAEEAIFYFDVTLLMLGAAFDATARVAHGVHELPSSPRSASWANEDWRTRLSAKNPALAQLMAAGQPARDARELIAVLRNTIHSQALRTITFRQDSGRPEELVIVPPSIESELETLVQRQPDAPAFAIGRTPGGHLHLDPGLYVEALFPKAVAALNAIMDATPVEELDGVDPAKRCSALRWRRRTTTSSTRHCGGGCECWRASPSRHLERDCRAVRRQSASLEGALAGRNRQHGAPRSSRSWRVVFTGGHRQLAKTSASLRAQAT